MKNDYGKMTVKYDSGNASLLEVGWELLNKRSASQMNEQIIRNEDYYIALGYLAASSFILVQMPKNKSEKFIDEHFERTGEVLENDYLNGYQIVSNWGIQMRISFSKNIFSAVPLPTLKDLAIERAKNNDSLMQINSNTWVTELLNLGFNVGNRHNSEKISTSIPSRHKEAFQVGFEIGKESSKVVEKSIYFPVGCGCVA
jgi:hypothetical protein